MEKETPKAASFTCPYCHGHGSVFVPGVNGNKLVTSIRTCRKCRGTGRLVVINDNIKFKK